MKICICTTPIRPEPTTFPPLGSLAIIQSLQSIGLKPEFYNIDFHRYNKNEIKNYFQNKQFDIVGISAVVSTAYSFTKELCSTIKALNNNTIIIVGGGLVASAHLLHNISNVDYCVVGDGEKIIINLTELLLRKQYTEYDLNKIKGITYLNKKNEFIFTGYGKPLAADEILIPDYSILEKYGKEMNE